jgi:DNA-binding MarR family transcriptional regulator
MTNRLDRLEAAGHIRRVPDPNDRRSVLVELTESGWKLWQASVGVQATKERLLASSMTDAQKEQLNGLLRHLMLAFGKTSRTEPMEQPATSEAATVSAATG